jgi:hypothetical protein
MSTRLIVLPQNGDTQFVPLAVLSYCLTRTQFLVPPRKRAGLQESASASAARKTARHPGEYPGSLFVSAPE